MFLSDLRSSGFGTFVHPFGFSAILYIKLLSTYLIGSGPALALVPYHIPVFFSFVDLECSIPFLLSLN